MRITSTHCEFVPLQHYNFVIHDIPKVLAIILANEVQYSVSEIDMLDRNEDDPRQEALYSKWVDIFYEAILKNNPDIQKPKAGAIAVKNASYLKSSFSLVTIEYAVDLRTLGYLINRLKRFISRSKDFKGPSDFFEKLRLPVGDFVSQIEGIFKDNLRQNEIDGSLVSFEKTIKNDVYGNDTFNRSCLMSLDCLFDMLEYNDRISCSLQIPKELTFIIPQAINEYGIDDLESTWVNDINSISDLYPVGMLVRVSESGSTVAFNRRIERIIMDSSELSFEMVSQACATVHGFKNALKISGVESETSLFFYLEQYCGTLMENTGCNCLNNLCKRAKLCR